MKKEGGLKASLVPVRRNEILGLVSLGPGRIPYYHPTDPNFVLCMEEDLIKMSMCEYLINQTMGLVIECDMCLRH